jgi:hypothetical protein
MRDGGGRKESPEGVRCGGGGGRSAASSVGVRDLEAEGELDQAGVGRKECDGAGDVRMLPREITDSEMVLIVPRSWSYGSASTADWGGSLGGTGFD